MFLKGPVTLLHRPDLVGQVEEEAGDGFKMPDSFKAAVLCRSCPETLANHLKLHAAKKAFSEVERIATEFLRTTVPKDKDDMEVDAIYGKGGTNGKDGKKGGKEGKKGREGKKGDHRQSHGKYGKKGDYKGNAYGKSGK